VHCEADIANSSRDIPVNTTGEVRIDVGQPKQAVAVPLDAASITGSKAVLYVVESGVAHKTIGKVLGERGGTLYLDPALRAGSQVVTEGRAVLADGDGVAAKPSTFAPEATGQAPKEETKR
jgi:multidrug efflux pump subunit AcrA (membrane-fusion protein)